MSKQTFFKTILIMGVCFIALLTVVPHSTMAQGVAPKPTAREAAVIAEITKQISTVEFITNGRKKTSESLSLKIDRLNQKRLEILSGQDKLGVSDDSFPEIIKSLQTKRINLLIDLAGLEKRREAILTKHPRTPVGKKSDLLVSSLKKMLALEELNVEHLSKLRDSGVRPKLDLDAERRLLEIQIRLAESTRTMTVSPILDDSLLKTTLDLVEKRARLAKTESLLESILASRPSIDEASAITRELAMRRKQLTHVEQSTLGHESELEQLNKQLDALLNLKRNKD